MTTTPFNGTAAAGLAVHAETDRLMAQAQGGGGSNEKAKIEKAGRDFESILLGSWLQGAEQSFAAAPGGDDEEDSSREQFMGMAMQQLAGTLTASGGIGLARMISSHLEAAANHKSAGPESPPRGEVTEKAP